MVVVSDVTPVSVFSSLNVARGGMTKAVMRRANMFTEHFDDVRILTLLFQQNHREIIQKLYQSGQLNKKVKVSNCFIEMDPFKEKKPSKDNMANPNIKEEGFHELKASAKPTPSYRYYRDGLYVKYKRFDNEGKVVFVDVMNESRHRTHRMEYDEEGYLVRMRHMDIVKNKPRLDRYFSRNGKCYLSVWMNPDTGEAGRCQLFYPEPKEFKNLTALYSFWIKKELKRIRNPVLLSDSRRTDAVLLDIPSRIKKVTTLHNNHYQKPFTKEAPIRTGWRNLFENLDKFDRVVFLTHEQMKDVSDQFGTLDSYRIIPHEAKRVSAKNNTEANPHLAVSLARYEPQKRLDEAIQAFAHVVKEIPNARYEIYGHGSEEKELQALIEQLGLENHIKLMGYTNDPVRTYQRAACTVLSSDYEGSPLVINESLAAGTPVVVYNFKYGPKDVIRDGLDGFVVPKGDQKALAGKIIEIMKNPPLRERMSNHALEIVERFSFEKYEKNWVQLVKELEAEKPKNKPTMKSKLKKGFKKLLKL